MPDYQITDGGQGVKRRTRCEKNLIIAVCLLAALALIFLLIIAFRKCTIEEVCTTKHCVKASAELLEYVNLNEDPCNNFYMYTCGSYFENVVKKETTSPWTSTNKLFKNELKYIMVDRIRPTKDSKPQILLKQFYHACINETKIDEDENRTFMEAIDELGGWPLVNGTNWNSTNFDWVDWYIKARNMGLPVIGLFNFKTDTTTSKIILKVTGPNLDIESDTSDLRFRTVMKGVTNSFENFDHTRENRELHKFIIELFSYRDVEEKPNEAGNDDYNDDTDYDSNAKKEKVTISNIEKLTKTCPTIPWLKILNGISGNSSHFVNSSAIAFQVKKLRNYCKDLTDLLTNTDPKVIANYYIWSIIYRSHDFLGKKIRKAYQDDAEYYDDRFTYCFKTTDKRFKFVKETIYVRKKTDDNVKNQLREMIEIMKELFVEHLKKCEWMDEKTRTVAVAKAQKIASIIGGDEEVYDVDQFDKVLGIDGLNFTSDNIYRMLQEKNLKEDQHFFGSLYSPLEEEWDDFFNQALQVNAFFVQDSNSMVIPAPILTSIFFNKKFPAFMNYGAMGSTVGHELMHGFSKSARKYLQDDGEYMDWWTNTTEKLFDKKVQCVINEYEMIPFRYRLNGTLTLDENLADYVGADLGYEAYQRYVKKHGTEEKLPGLPLTPEQIYWVQTATNFCFRKLDDNEIDYEEEDQHGIPTFRVQAPARNSKHFAEAFNCPLGSFMNPKEKCKIL